jgi:hypothetical protein
MDSTSLLYIILIPIAINIVSTIMYDFVKPRFIKWQAQTSIDAAQSRASDLKEQIDEVTKYKNDSDLLVKVALREILRAFWSVFVTGVIIVIYFIRAVGDNFTNNEQ